MQFVQKRFRTYSRHTIITKIVNLSSDYRFSQCGAFEIGAASRLTQTAMKNSALGWVRSDCFYPQSSNVPVGGDTTQDSLPLKKRKTEGKLWPYFKALLYQILIKPLQMVVSIQGVAKFR
jgi:hypothetical protein